MTLDERIEQALTKRFVGWGEISNVLRESQQRIRELERDIERRQNEEASVCPEDVGVVEYIRTLKACTTSQREALKLARAELQSIAKWPEPTPGAGLSPMHGAGMYAQYDIDRKRHEAEITEALAEISKAVGE